MSKNTEGAPSPGAADLVTLNHLRLSEDLSYAELGEQIGIDAGVLHKILNGKSEPYDRTLFKVRLFLEKREAEAEAAKRAAKRRAS